MGTHALTLRDQYLICEITLISDHSQSI